MTRRPARHLRIAALLGTLPCAAPAAQAPAGSAALAAEVRRLAHAAGGSVGVGIRHLERGEEVYVNGDRAFLMGSTVKVAVAITLLRRVDQGAERLDRRVPLLAGDLFPSGSLLSQRFRDTADPGADLALIRYLELMLILSDNAATDVILREIGGTAAVTARLRELGIQDLRVDRTVMQVYWDYLGLGEPPPVGERHLGTLAGRMAGRTSAALAEAQRAYHASEKDRATPRAMVRLLTLLWQRQALTPASTELLLGVMRREETGADRLAGRLPPGTPVASKTGTYGTIVANDVGIVSLPDGAGHLAVVVFTEDPATGIADKSRLIADVARAAYDYFLLAAAGR